MIALDTLIKFTAAASCVIKGITFAHLDAFEFIKNSIKRIYKIMWHVCTYDFYVSSGKCTYAY